MRIRRRTLVLVAACITIGLGGIVAIGIGWLLKTQTGRNIVAREFEKFVRGKVRGNKVYVGRLSCSLLSAPCLDSLEIRDLDDSVLVATGPIAFKYDLIDLWDGRIKFTDLSIQRPFVHLRQDSTGAWNWRKLLGPSGPSAPRSMPSTGLHLGDVILVDSLSLVGGTFRWTQPWNPPSGLNRTERDSSIAHNVARTDAKIQHAGDALIRVREWTGIVAAVPHARIRQPGTEGLAFDIGRLDFDEFDPPFIVREARGKATIAHDTVQIDFDALRLPGSHGSAHGYISGKDGLAVNVRVIADTVSMSDIAWIYPTLPKEGGGSVTLDIRKGLKDNVTDYALSKMDVSTTRSRMTGAMTFGVGDPILAVKNVDLVLKPVDFKLFEQFAGKPFPIPWAGQLLGRVWGPGGPLNKFRVDSMAIDFADANVPGVVNQFHGNGEVDIVSPAYAVFHDFALRVDHFDLRTAQALNKNFAPLLGSVAGTARLDSIWSDVRFRDGDIHYYVDSAPESRFNGSGRVTVGDVEMAYDLVLNANPISLDAIAKSYPKMGVRGSYSGPFTVQGTLGDLAVAGDLSGAFGRVQADVRIDELLPLYGGSGTVTLTGADLSRALVGAADWKGQLNATIEAAVRWDSIANLDGGAKVTLRRSDLGGIKFYSGNAGLKFADGMMQVDTLALQSSVAAVDAKGGLGLRRDRSGDSLRVVASVDSLGGLRPLIAPLKDSLPADSLAGGLNVSLWLLGNVDSLALRGDATGRDLTYGSLSAKHATFLAAIEDLFGRRTGTVTVLADSGSAGGVSLARLKADARLTGGDTARVNATLISMTGPVAEGAANVAWDSLSVRAALDSLHLTVSDHDWRLTKTAQLTFARDSMSIDGFALASGALASVEFNASLPDSSAVRGTLVAQAFPLGDLGQLLQVSLPLGGDAALRVDLTGTRSSPKIDFQMKAQNARVGETTVEGLQGTGQYADRVLNAEVNYKSKGVTVLDGKAQLPMDLSLRKVAKRLLDSPLSGSIKADSADLAVAETFTPTIRQSTGRLDMALTLGGTWKEPRLNGKMNVTNGAFAITSLGNTRYSNVLAQIGFFGDSISIDTLFAHSGRDPSDRAIATGWIKLADFNDPAFNLKLFASDFHVVESDRIAQLQITTRPGQDFRLVGSQSGSTLTGEAVITGTIRIPNAGKKTVFSLDDPEYYRLDDTTVFSNRALMPSPPPRIIENMQTTVKITAGDNLWLRSEEADVKLAGSLDVTAVRLKQQANGRRPLRLGLDGTLTAEQGTYRLNMGFLQKTFAVEPGGTVRFYGDDPNLDPTIAIRGLYVVRQYDQREARQDVRIRVELGGTLSALTLQLSSPDGLRLSPTDLLSYLVTGAPSFDIGGRVSDYGSTAARIGVSSFGSFLGSKVAGGFCDVVDIATAGLQSGYNTKSGSELLSGTRVGCGKQWYWNTFVHFDFGLCAVAQVASDPVSLANTFGLKVDKRFRGGLNVSLGLDPPTSAILCSQATNARGFVPTPRQGGIDLFRNWRW